MSTLKTTNLQNADASSANIVLGQGSGGGATITGVTTTTTLQTADSIIHTGDTDTKIRFPSADTVTVETGGTERARITSTGKVNVGAASPTASENGQFNCYTTTSSGKAQFVHDAGTGGLRLAGTGSGSGANLVFSNNYNSGTFSDHWTLTHNGGDDSFRFLSGGTGGTERLRIDSSGRLLLGTTTAATGSKLTISGTDATNYITVKNTTASDSSGARLSKIIFQGTQSGSEVSDLVHLAAMHDGGADNQMGAFRIYINDGNDNAAPTERFGIGQGGEYRVNQSIGTAGQVIKSAGSGSPAVWGDASAGIDIAQQWRLTSSATGNQVPLTGWEKVDTLGGGGFGSNMTESSGIFTFPSTGFWLIGFQMHGDSDNHTQNLIARIDVTTNNSSYAHASRVAQGIYDYNNSYPSHAALYCEHIFDVTNVSTHKVRFSYGAGQGGERVRGDSNYTYTGVTFVRIGDT